ncbi:uncharacterized protein J8A68_003344 [[Candida] subhashii]|uniref:FAD/NAD(P)-binding domain-containing protein n=1 Tax=[Candida] subhashii TaxID=561895 RepID=A0A8J5UMA1_9ASCO|nr:uncharacterized protein J8A68_003344 [[Candida] subhashii]KAG7663166.1 hypothetical protein J8A68_003344 [[Candida] subhashii]
MTNNTKRVIILGASYAGILALRTLLSRKNPANLELVIRIISPNDHTYFNMSSPRLLVEPDSINKVVFSLQDLISKLKVNSKHKVEYVQGSVKNVDLDNRQVDLHKSESSLNYDYLMVATGTRSDCLALKLDNLLDHSYSINAVKRLSEDIKHAESIAVVGAGITGVEVIAELSSNYGKTTTFDLYTGNEHLLPELKECHRRQVVERLTNFGVSIINNEKVKVSKDSKSVIFKDGTVKEYSLVIPTFRNIPNTEFLPGKVLAASGYVYTDKHLRLEKYHNVICLGDILEMGASSCVDLVYAQKSVLESTVDYEIFEQKSVKLKTHKKYEPSYQFVIPLGKDGGVGVAYGICLPNFLVRYAKAKDYFIPKAKEVFG